MISIEAIVRPERVSQVTAALVEAGCPGFYYYNITGEGRQRGVEVFVGRGGQMATRATVPKTLIRTVVGEDLKDAIIAAIINSARGPGEGAIGDGKIFVSTVEDAVRVRTGERGGDAI
jgi:nitrogen regulatory protein P-II 1